MTSVARLCEEKVNEIGFLLVRLVDEGHSDDLAFDLRQAADEADDLATEAPSSGHGSRLREAAAKARARADRRDPAALQLEARRVDLAVAIRDADLDPPWRVHGYAADGYLTVEAGRGGEGKSLKALALVGGVLRGDTVAGYRCEPGRAVIFDAENGVPLIGQRLKASDTPLAGLTIFEAAGLDVATDHAAIEQAVIDARANLVVFDSLRTLAPRAKENDSDDMAPIMGALRGIARRTNAAVLLLHHRDKALEHDFRGSGAIHDQADMVFVLGRDPKDPQGATRRYVRCAKCRIAQEPADRWLTIKHWRGNITLHEATSPNDDARPAAAPQRDELADRALDVLRTADEPLTGAAVARRLGRDKADGTVRRALERLRADSRITRDDRSRWALPEGLPPHEAATAEATTPEEHQNPSSRRDSGVATQPHGNPDNGRCQGAPPPKGGAGWQPNGHSQALIDELAAAFDARVEQP